MDNKDIIVRQAAKIIELISIHVPRMRDDPPRPGKQGTDVYFNPRPSHEGRRGIAWVREWGG